MRREDLREKIIQTIFQMDALGDFDYLNLKIIDENIDILEKDRAIKIFNNLKAHKKDIDKLISDNLSGWKFERIPKVELAILRNAICEINYIDDIPMAVSIDQAVILAKKYGNEKSYVYINGILGEIIKSKG